MIIVATPIIFVTGSQTITPLLVWSSPAGESSRTSETLRVIVERPLEEVVVDTYVEVISYLSCKLLFGTPVPELLA